jgi:hypothetical protein
MAGPRKVALVAGRIGRGAGRAVVWGGVVVLVLGCAATERPGPVVAVPDLEAGATLENMPAAVAEKPGEVALRFAWPVPSEARCATV